MPTKILLADDSITIQKVVNLTFATEDVMIESVMDGHQAVEKASTIRPDIVLADVFMPGRNGYEVCAAIKSDPQLAAIPVVLLVGTFEPFDEIEAARVKCDAYLTKPFDTAELIEIVHSLVAQRSAPPINAEAAVKAADAQVRHAAEGVAEHADVGALVSERTRESFLGSNRILDLFDFSVPPAEAAGSCASPPETPDVAAAAETDDARQSAPPPHVIPFPGARSGGPEPFPIALTEEMVNMIVEKVVKRMSQEVVRDIAWEVVPELSEIMIRQYLDELKRLPEK